MKDREGEAKTGIPTRQGKEGQGLLQTPEARKGQGQFLPPGLRRSQFNRHSHLRLAFRNKKNIKLLFKTLGS